jgi:predicted MFS family arabinose efflux permease
VANASKDRGLGKRKDSKLARWFRRALIAVAWLYPLLLAATALAFVTLGEDWWVTAALMYLPRWAFAAPLAVLVPGLLVVRRRRHCGASCSR